VIDQRAHRARVLHRVHLHLHRVHNLAKNVLLVVDDLIALVQLVKFRKVVKSAIHAGFAPLHKNAINREFAHESLNLIFLKMSQARNSRRAFALSC
jgi:hypothetical protein